MGLQIPYDPAGLDPKIVGAFDDITASVQAWATKTVNPLGLWTPITFEASDFFMLDAALNAAGPWTVIADNVLESSGVYRYAVIGNMMILQVTVTSSTTGPTANGIYACIRLPPGYRIDGRQQCLGAVRWTDTAAATVNGVGFGTAFPRDSFAGFDCVTLQKSGTAWAANSTLSVYATLVFGVEPIP